MVYFVQFMNFVCVGNSKAVVFVENNCSNIALPILSLKGFLERNRKVIEGCYGVMRKT